MAKVDLSAALRARDAFLAKVAMELEARVDRLEALGRTRRATTPREVRAAVAELQAFARELRLIARPELPVVARARRVDVLLWLVGTMRRHRSALEARGFVLAVSRTGGAVVGRFDPSHLETVFGELLSNAVKYARRGAITVRCEVRGGRLAWTFRDEGAPRAARRTRLGVRFRRGDPRSPVPGFGVGLWLVRRIARAYGGHLRFTSGVAGATARVTLPVARAAPDARFEARLVRRASSLVGRGR